MEQKNRIVIQRTCFFINVPEDWVGGKRDVCEQQRIVVETCVSDKLLDDVS